ncbi:pectate lyase [Leuconostoc holzapfelii]|uniref:Pectate lyase n=1 Tax=Leuconostoc holzapfelii TaxID=434464 RepID=A0ABT2NX46_9LACO|nr:pectate lyase [Leuconostoc holzapfelii]MCT8389951.1 pectate lyase [Leuconostoc holzapfelii]
MKKAERSKLFSATVMAGMLALSVTTGLRDVHADMSGYAAQTASTVGGFGGNTTGGSQATAAHTYTVADRASLLKALGGENNATPKIIYVSGKIDMNVNDQGQTLTAADYAQGTGYNFERYLAAYAPSTWGKKKLSGVQEADRLQAQKNQAAQVVVKVPANTTIIGEPGAQFIGGNLVIQKGNVIVRNLYFETPYDDFPQWDPTDEGTGNWNSQYDAISVQGASNVWLDHNTFDDGTHPDAQNGTYYGREYQHHDGDTDFTNGANNITVSDNIYRNHDKTMLIGNSDTKTTDAGKLHVTVTHNLFENTVQRTPRVRYGEVQVVNNLYQNDGTSSYKFKYAWGLGKNAQIAAQNNVLNIANASASDIISKLKGTQLSDSGTQFNGASVSASTLSHTAPITWQPTAPANLTPTNQVQATVMSQAGADVLK